MITSDMLRIYMDKSVFAVEKKKDKEKKAAMLQHRRNWLKAVKMSPTMVDWFLLKNNTPKNRPPQKKPQQTNKRSNPHPPPPPPPLTNWVDWVGREEKEQKIMLKVMLKVRDCTERAGDHAEGQSGWRLVVKDFVEPYPQWEPEATRL